MRTKLVNEGYINLGSVVITPAASNLLDSLNKNMFDYLKKHVRGDWGSINDDENDREANENAIKSGQGLVMSSYLVDARNKLWIMTEAVGDSVVTTILTPQDY